MDLPEIVANCIQQVLKLITITRGEL